MPGDGKKLAIGAGVAAAVGLALFLLTRKAEAKPPTPPPGKANLYGKVTDAYTGRPLADALVILDGYSILTNSSGYYEFLNLEPGSYSGQVSKEDYLTQAM